MPLWLTGPLRPPDAAGISRWPASSPSRRAIVRSSDRACSTSCVDMSWNCMAVVAPSRPARNASACLAAGVPAVSRSNSPASRSKSEKRRIRSPPAWSSSRSRRSRSAAAVTTFAWTRLAASGGRFVATGVPRSGAACRPGRSSLCIDIVIFIRSSPILPGRARPASPDKQPKPRTIPNPWNWHARQNWLPIGGCGS